MVIENRAFGLIAVVGAAGQTGRLYTESFATMGIPIEIEAVIRRNQLDRYSLLKPPGPVTISTNLQETLAHQPDIVLVATPNPTEEILTEIAKGPTRPLTLVLPQNGVDVVPTAQRVLERQSGIRIVRACLFTTIGTDKEGNLVYNHEKKRIAIAPVLRDHEESSTQMDDSLERTRTLFEAGGFAVNIQPDYKSMEQTKLLANGLGSTAAITGLSPLETFRDKVLFALEHRSLRDRIKILEAAGIPFADIPWVRQLKLLAAIPTPVASLARNFIAKRISRERNNQPPAAARQIVDGKKPEAGLYYHKPWIDLGEKHGLKSPMDEAIYEIIKRHSQRKEGFNLNSMNADARKKHLFEVINLETLKPYISRNRIMEAVLEAFIGLYTQELKVEGLGNLQVATESLKAGHSVVFAPNHFSHADHPVIVKALKKVLGKELGGYELVFIAGMKFGKDLVSKLFEKAYDHILVWTLKKDMSSEEKWRAKRINEKAKRKTEDVLKKPVIFIVYIEGTRSLNGKPGEPVIGAGGYFIHENTEMVVPVAIKGTEKMLPPGKVEDKIGNRWPGLAKILSALGLGKMNDFQLPNKARLSVEFLRPKETVDLIQRASDFPKNLRDGAMTGEVMNEIKRSFSDET